METHTDIPPLEIGNFYTNKFGDRYLLSVNNHTFDRIGSDSVYQSHWEDELLKENTLYIIAGCDSGLLINYILRRDIPEGSRYIFVELNELLPIIDPIIEEYGNDKKLTVCSLDEWQEIAKKRALSEYSYLDSVKLIKSLAVEDSSVTHYRILWRQLENEFQLISWAYQSEFGNSTFITRQFENIAENRHSAICLKDSFIDKTAVLLAGGPSLDEIFPWLQENRKNLAVISVSRISRRLQQMGITPDIVVTVDPHPCSYDVSKQMLNFGENTILVNSYHSSPLLLGQWQGRSLYFGCRYPWTNTDKKEILPGTGPTVSNSALTLAISMGFKTVVLAGLDLCFTNTGISHAQGSVEHEEGALVGFVGQTIETNAGTIAETDNAFFNATKNIAAQAKFAVEQNCQFINPFPNAARIDNVLHISLDEIRLQDLDKPAIETINSRLPNDGLSERKNSYVSAEKELTKLIVKIEKIRTLAKQALTYNDGLFGRNGKQKDFKYKIKMDRIEKQLNKEFGDIPAIVKIFGMKEFVKTFRPDNEQEWTDEDIENTGKNYYQAFVTGATRLLIVAHNSESRLQARMLEEAEQPDFPILFKQWDKDTQPGRALLWKHRQQHSFTQLPSNIREKFDDYTIRYQNDIKDLDHKHRQVLKKRADLSGVPGKASEYYRSYDSIGLKRLLSGLQTRQETEAELLIALVNAYIFEIEKNNSHALQAYKTIVEKDNLELNSLTNKILEAALIRLSISKLNQQQYDEAQIYLERLSISSTSYQPLYADLLRINNELEKSIDVYTEYLSKVPDDLATMMKLGMIYHRLGVVEGAKWVFQYVSEKDPSNQAARSLLEEIVQSA